jgi:hypothetical protein
MPSIPIDVLREILEHVDEIDDLATLCRVNKIFCFCSRDVLYREIEDEDERVIQTLSQSTDLARRVRWFATSCKGPELAMALRNMSSLNSLYLHGKGDEAPILDGCTFKLDSFGCSFPYSESLQNFLNSQPSLTHVTFSADFEPSTPFDEKCLPNLTRAYAPLPWLSTLIPGRPVRDVIVFTPSSIDPIDWSFFTSSTTPIQKLYISYDMLYQKPVSLLVSIFPSLVHLAVYVWDVDLTVRVPICLSI